MSVCVCSGLTFWRTEGIYFKSQKRCFDQPHLAQSWHQDPGEKRNAGGQTSLFWLKCLIQTHLILLPGVEVGLGAASGTRAEAQLAK